MEKFFGFFTHIRASIREEAANALSNIIVKESKYLESILTNGCSLDTIFEVSLKDKLDVILDFLSERDTINDFRRRKSQFGFY